MFEMHQMQDLIDISQGNTEKRHLLIDRAHGKKKWRPSVKKGNGVNTPSKFYIYKGSEYSVRELADIAGFKCATIRQRLTYGWSVEDAVHKPLQVHHP